MSEVMLEHVNFTVADPAATARTLCDLFDWRIRWEGAAKDGGHSVHVGGENSYLALYRPAKPMTEKLVAVEGGTYRTKGGMNHVAVTVDDIDAMEKKVKAAGFTPGNHADYEPGRRFYFFNEDGIEFEVVSYA